MLSIYIYQDEGKKIINDNCKQRIEKVKLRQNCDKEIKKAYKINCKLLIIICRGDKI